jgi:galactose mutarotase-like enzyme
MSQTVLSRENFEGVPAVALRNASLDVTVLPTLGARIVSLRSRRTEREWLWRAEDGRGLFASPSEAAFERGPLAGIDECLPTVAPCDDFGRHLPDHGEAWTSAWSAETTGGGLINQLELRCVPLRLRRRLSLDGDTLRLEYELTNHGPQRTRYVWALHPLLVWRPGDRVELGGDSPVRLTALRGPRLLTNAAGLWPEPLPGVRLDRGELGAAQDVYCKAFLDTARARTIALISGGEKLEFAVDARETPHWGYWLTQGGWHGHTHLALEPTNVPADSPPDIPSGNKAGLISAGEVRRWSVRLTVSEPGELQEE